MERPIQYNLLLQDELIHEITIRGAQPLKTVTELKAQIRKLGKEIPCEDVITTDLNPEEEVRALSHHLYYRLTRIDSEINKTLYETIETTLNECLLKIDNLFASFKTSFEEPMTHQSPSDAARSQCPESCYSNAILKLNTKYDGGPCVLTYLQRLNELCESRNINEKQLFNSAVELFTDKALIWFRSIKTTIQDWNNLKLALISEFSPIDYNDKLMVEVQKRTQGITESSTLYIAIMLNYFSRFTITIPENEQLKIIQNNLRPELQMALALYEISDISELRNKCKLLDYTREIEVLTFVNHLKYHHIRSHQILVSNTKEFKKLVYPSRSFYNSNLYPTNKKLNNNFRNKKVLRNFKNTINTTTVRKNENDIRPYLKIKIYDQSYFGLLDSGSSLSILGGNTGNIFLHHGLSLQHSNSIKEISTANNSSSKVLGYFLLPVQVNNVTQVIQFYMIPSVTSPMILGVDFWKKFNIAPEIFDKLPVVNSVELPTSVSEIHHLQPFENLKPDEQKLAEDVMEKFENISSEKKRFRTYARSLYTMEISFRIPN
ncbi:hypothetical protein K1T71_014841 [Dendrolimus kikuchii]|nr:hypothetical protein K1T71_014841 [Dendrolimus kikuchii]